MDYYNELLQKYNAALKTITDLQAENRQLKARLGTSEIAPTANDKKIEWERQQFLFCFRTVNMQDLFFRI